MMRLLRSNIRYVTAKLFSLAKLCTVSPVDENMHPRLATCNEPLYHLHPVVFFEVVPRRLVL